MRIPYDQIVATLTPILRANGLSEKRARTCAEVFAGNNRDGVATHGLDRFVGFVKNLGSETLDPAAEPTVCERRGGFEQWDGHCGPGILNALAATDRVMELADEHGVGCVAMRNTNHWFRPGTYGWRAAEAGYFFACWTNTQPNMIAWKSYERVVGNNPIVLAFPSEPNPVVVDMSLSQYSMGRLEEARRDGRNLDVPAGYDAQGNESHDPATVLGTNRHSPIGHWKGAGLAMLLDLFAAGLSGGKTTVDIKMQGAEFAVSQVFLAWTPGDSRERLNAIADSAIADLRATEPADSNEPLRYPGERALQSRLESEHQGVLVNQDTWRVIEELADDDGK